MNICLAVLSKLKNILNMFYLLNRVSQEVAALLRRLGLSYQGNGSYGKIRINGITIRKWFQPKLGSPFTEKKNGT